VLDPAGERQRIAVAHLRGCPACRRRVASLRGLAVVLPPVLTFPGAGKAGLAALVAGGHGAAAPAPLGASAAAGSGAAGGGWAVGGSGLAAKLAAGCLLVLGVGAGCAVLGRSAHRGGHSSPPAWRNTAGLPPRIEPGAVPRSAGPVPVRPRPASETPRPAGQQREFTPEQPPPSAPSARVARTATDRSRATGVTPSAGANAAEHEFAPG
jgi:hypothetical protein